MKAKLLTILLLTLTLKVSGQLPQCDLLKNASISYCNNDYNTSIKNLLEFREKFPKHALIEEVNQQIGHLYFLKLDFEKSKMELTTLINGKPIGEVNDEYKALECVTNYDSSNFKCMRIVFPEPYTHLQHLACLDLFEIFKKEKQYDKSLEYLQLADKKYIYNTFSGNGNNMIKIAMALRYKEIYLLKVDTNAAIKELSNEIFTIEVGHSEIIQSLKTLLFLKYTPEQILAEVNNAINSIHQQEKVVNDKKYSWFEMNLFGHTIQIPSTYSEFGRIETVVKMKEKIKKEKFFMDLGN